VSRSKSFPGAILAGASLTLALAAYTHFTRDTTTDAVAGVQMRELAPGVLVSAQLQPQDLPRLRAQGVQSVIDLRPDGESADQPDSAAMTAAAARSGLDFCYAPTPHGAPPADLRASFRKSFEESPRPTVLYCRSGSRAARMWALLEAARPDGLSADEIVQRAAAAGHALAPVRAEIEELIARRSDRSARR
jgi:uncharacterized protein (TIGR01244 family)